MEIRKYTCPSCGASLEINVSLKHAVCNYCGQAIDVVSDAAKYGTVNQELLDKIQLLAEPSVRHRELLAKIEREDSGLKSLNSKLGLVIVIIAVISFFVFIFLPILGGIFYLGHYIAAPMLFIFGGGICFYGTNIFAAYYNNRTNDLVKKKQEEINSLLKMKQDIEEKYDINFVPYKYRTKDAFEYMYIVVSSLRANSLQQAINLYEDELKRRELQKQQEALIKQQEEKIREMEEQRKQDREDDLLKTVLTVGGIATIGAALWNHKDDLF